MKRSMATVCLSGNLAEKLQAIAAAGFDGVEIFESDFVAFDGGACEVGRLVRDLGLKITAFQPFRDFEGLPEPGRSKAFARAEKKFELMQQLGADLLLICSNVSPSANGGFDRAADDLRLLAERAHRCGLRIGYEALAWGRHVFDYRDAWEIVRRADHPSLGIVLDTFHALALDLPVEAIAAIPGDRIFLVQVADAPRLTMDLLSWSRHFRSFPGQGELALAGFMGALLATGFDGPLSLEVFNDQFRAGVASRVAIDGMRSLMLLENDVSGQDRLPPMASCMGIDHIEFAIQGSQAEQLGTLLAGMGFRRSGVGRAGTLHRWTQGSIELVINTETEGFAGRHSRLHGPGVCSIGLKVADVASAVRRAQSLQIPVVKAEGAGELPAVGGVGESLICFVDEQGALRNGWIRDFALIEAPSETGAHLVSVDHVAQSMQHDEMLSWILFYAAMFDLRHTSPVDVPDPAGLVQSRALANLTGSLRFTLNATQAQRTLSARFISEFVGSGVQHVAFATPDIFAAARAMRVSGVPMLTIPNNYYDDVAAKHGLDPARVDALRENGILYDRDGEAEFFQMYTGVFADRFFFEIVERRRYPGFGEANAPVRLAAQARDASRRSKPRDLGLDAQSA